MKKNCCKENINQLTSSRKVGIRDINTAFAPISRIKTLRDDEGRRGFTLIELLVVVLIIGILAAIALPQYQKAVEKARAAEAITILKEMDKAQQLCMLEHDAACTARDFFENSDYKPPTPLLEDECLDTPPCFRTADWEIWSDDWLYAGRLKNNELVGGLYISTYSEYPNVKCGAHYINGEGREYCNSLGMPFEP